MKEKTLIENIERELSTTLTILDDTRLGDTSHRLHMAMKHLVGLKKRLKKMSSAERQIAYASENNYETVMKKIDEEGCPLFLNRNCEINF